MSAKINNFYKHAFKDFFESLLNLFIFFPYFFSVGPLLKTLFAPWKNLTFAKKTKGFSLNAVFEQMISNLVSRWIGFTMRSTVIFAFFIFMFLYIVALPFIILLHFLFVPFEFLLALVMKTDEEKAQAAKEQFLKTHLLKEENREVVSKWFDAHYRIQFYKSQWWKLPNLFSTAPLARDWSVGYTPTLDNFTQDLMSSAYHKHRHQIIGRKKEIQQVEEILSKQEESNALLVGDQGVGKHTIVDALAKHMYDGTSSTQLAYKRLLKLNMEKILTQSSDQKEREKFLEDLFEEAARSRNVILMIDNFDKYVTFGDDRVNLTIPIETYAKTSSLQFIGITSPTAYDQFIFSNEKISHIFTKIPVNEISPSAALTILLEEHHEYEKRYHVTIPYETLKETIEKSDFFITEIPFPEKAMQLLDSTCVYAAQNLKQKVVTPEMVNHVLSQQTHTPTQVNDDLKTKLLNLEEDLKQRVINQDDAVGELAAALRRSFLLLGKRRKPLASFLFLGPTGVGKTETAKALAARFFNTEDVLLRFDMSNYQSKNDIPKLIGSMETQQPGILTNAVRGHPYGILLLDEIEKAHIDLLNIFLTILDEGYFTDGFGKRVDAKNLVIIATSNAGADYLFQQFQKNQTPNSQLSTPNSQVPASNSQLPTPNSQSPGVSTNDLIAHLIEKHYFTPEFLNRFDGVIAYRPVQSDSMILIARKMLEKVRGQIYQLHKVTVNVSDQTLHDVISKNFNPAFGARNLDRILRNEIEDKVAKMVLSNQAKEGDVINL
jgi:ATP-dependent Clp protease ATP-binding subunit ClpA